MPRSRPGALRAAQHADPSTVRQWARDGGPIDGLTPATSSAIRVVEHGGVVVESTTDRACFHPDPFHLHVRPGRTAELLGAYRKFLRQPVRKLRPRASLCPSCPSCQYVDIAVVRDALEAVTRLLPPAARTEMRRLLHNLDHEFRHRTQPDSSPRTHWNDEPLPWWHRRIYSQ